MTLQFIFLDLFIKSGGDPLEFIGGSEEGCYINAGSYHFEFIMI